jgi:DNA invertase Pin-like site-specific DNA recombinase
MSTEHQQYSIDNQSDAISLYAREHQMLVVKTYADAGKSGLSAQNRPGLRQLIEDVEGSPDYSAILVYDVSRWGRFQDVDESAYYEYRCRRANIPVHYCAESFSNDGSPLATLLKAIKRTMAAEYSRDLSAKVFAGQARLTELGFRQGGTAGYGFRRLLVDQNGKPKFVLQPGERKSIMTDRIILIPGPSEEIEVVNEVFRLYAVERCSPAKIARTLNEHGIRSVGGRPWTRYLVRGMITNPKYIGANVSNRLSAKLRARRRVRNPPEMWVRRDNAFQAIVDPELFRKAEAVADSRSGPCTDEQLLEYLSEFLHNNGKLSERLIRSSLEMPCAQVYNVRFGGLAEAYRLIGYQPVRNLSYVERDRALLPIRRRFIVSVMDELVSLGASVRQDARTKLVVVNQNLTMRLVIAPCRPCKRFDRWKLHLYSPLKPDFTLIARLAPENKAILDYFYFPWREEAPRQITVGRVKASAFNARRFNDLTFLKGVLC